jgi:hypothetical protein
MVMGQEERKNKAKLEKTQIQLANNNTEYEAAVKALEETTGRWNRDWKAACDKFQDLEEERLDFMKSSLWTFANVASTVCVSDDASCEKIRLSLEKCEVEKDIASFIRERGTGQEIPDAPKYINFCRGDVNDTASEASDDENYSVAQFQRTINPSYRSGSPNPSTYSSHHNPDSVLATHMGLADPRTPESRESTVTPQKMPQSQNRVGEFQRQQQRDLEYAQRNAQQQALQSVPHNEYPPDGMTMYCRSGPQSERSANTSPARPSSRESNSDYSNPTSLSSQEDAKRQVNAIQAPSKYAPAIARDDEQPVAKKKSGFFQGHSPFRRKSKGDKEHRAQMQPQHTTPSRRVPYGQSNQAVILGGERQSGSPEPVDPRASFQLNVGNNVFDVATPDKPSRGSLHHTPDRTAQDSLNLDPIAQALAELKGVTKESSTRVSADRYHGIQTPAPPGTPGVTPGVPVINGNHSLAAAQRGTPPPSYDQPMKRLDLPQPAHTASAMRGTTQRYVNQTQNMLGGQGQDSPHKSDSGNNQRGYDNRSRSQAGTRGSGGDVMRATSPRPSYEGQNSHRTASPNPYAGRPQSRAQSAAQGQYQRHGSPGDFNRTASPQPYRPGSGQQGNNMQLELSPEPGMDDGFGGSQRGRGGPPAQGQGRPMSYYGGQQGGGGAVQLAQSNSRTRSKSVADSRQFSRDGRPVIYYGKPTISILK